MIQSPRLEIGHVQRLGPRSGFTRVFPLVIDVSFLELHLPLDKGVLGHAHVDQFLFGMDPHDAGAVDAVGVARVADALIEKETCDDILGRAFGNQAAAVLAVKVAGGLQVLFGNGAQAVLDRHIGCGLDHVVNGLGSMGQLAFDVGLDGALNDDIDEYAAQRQGEGKDHRIMQQQLIADGKVLQHWMHRLVGLIVGPEPLVG